MRYITHNPKDTELLAERLAEEIAPGTLILLSGDLGAGKTCFVRGLAKGLGVKEPVTSPTFTIVNQYEGKMPLFHVDLYRLERFPEEDISLEEMLKEGIVAVEWWEKDRSFFEKYTPSVTITIKVLTENEREIEISWERS